MASSVELLQRRERLRVGQRFLQVRPRIALLAALGNAALLAASSAPAAQKLWLGACFGLTLAAFFAESALLATRALGERWLFVSLGLTLLALAFGAACSGGLTGPLLPLLFAPVVVGFAAFARRRQAFALLAGAALLVLGLALGARALPFPALPARTLVAMLLLSTLASFALLFVGVSGLVEAHASAARELERLRADLLAEAERRAASVEHLGAQAAHEVKNPLAAARGLVELVQRRTSDERDGQRLTVVLGEIDRALRLLQDYLSFARPLSDLALSPIAARSLLEDVASVLEARAAEKSISLQITGDNVELWGDRQRLRDAVLNLSLNAIAALPAGGTLTLDAARAGDELRLSVLDNGPGIEPELLRKLGRPFTSGSREGSGLGVMIAESVARQHGGALHIESRPGAGTRARLELPLARGRQEPT